MATHTGFTAYAAAGMYCSLETPHWCEIEFSFIVYAASVTHTSLDYC